ncbi:MAG: M28 family peptidase [Phycisphaerales bacterium]|nr:M28 family peptidase [Phycisphaerales bacterium]
MQLPYIKQWRRVEPRAGAVAASENERAMSLAQELRRDVVMLSEHIGTRGVHSPKAYRLAREFLVSCLQRAGHVVKQHEYDEDGVTCANLEVVIEGDNPRALVVGAHYDSVENCPAANDNASGVAGILALARRLHGVKPKHTIRLVLFANEEPPYFNLNAMGSQIYARACKARADELVGMICLETIGCFLHESGSQNWPSGIAGLVLPTTGDFISFVGDTSSRGFIKRCAEVFGERAEVPLLAGAVPASVAPMVVWSDHRGFNESGYEAFMVTDTAPLRYKHYHQPTDTHEKLDYMTMARVMMGVERVVRAVAVRPTLTIS